MRHWTRIISLCLLGLQGYAQNIAVGTWRTHFSYKDARILEATQAKVFCAVENGLFSYDVAENSVRRLSKLDGLSGAGVTALEYSDLDNVLLIGYSSGLIDLVFEEEIITIEDIFESNLEVGKVINAATSRAGEMFLATDLGVIVIQLSNGKITENFFQIGFGGTQVSVSEIVLFQEQLFIVTNEGIQSGSLSQNLLDFNNWTFYESTTSFNNLTIAENQLFALNEGQLFQFADGSWTMAGIATPEPFTLLKDQEGKLLALGSSSVYELNGSTFTSLSTPDAAQINDLALLNNQLFLADGLEGLLSASGEPISPAGPSSDLYSSVKVVDNDLYAFHSPYFFPLDLEPISTSYSQFTSSAWEINSIPGFPNVSDVATFNGSRYFSSVGYGLYNEATNEVIDNVPGSNTLKDTVILSMAAKDRLWVAGVGEQPVHFMNADGNWVSFDGNEVFGSVFRKVRISETGIGWILGNGDITVVDPTEMQVDLLSISDGIPSVATDLDITVEDNTWVVSRGGPVFFPSASFIFFSSEGIRPTFENRLLFEDELINAVVTDGGNRIWFGTNRGLWVFDENTSEQVAVFTAQNSPLPSDMILNLAYNSITGEVFVVTDRGMVSYRSASSAGGRQHSNVNVFPNPVRPHYTGQVGISGLVSNANIKVTDINGNLVKELDANGGTASWDLRDQNGSNIGTGIYFLFSSDGDAEETYVGKIAVIR